MAKLYMGVKIKLKRPIVVSARANSRSSRNDRLKITRHRDRFYRESTVYVDGFPTGTARYRYGMRHMTSDFCKSIDDGFHGTPLSFSDSDKIHRVNIFINDLGKIGRANRVQSEPYDNIDIFPVFDNSCYPDEDRSWFQEFLRFEKYQI